MKKIIIYGNCHTGLIIEYLKACDQELMNDNGILHNIFNISSDVLASKYNITMEKLIEDYFVIPAKTL